MTKEEKQAKRDEIVSEFERSIEKMNSEIDWSSSLETAVAQAIGLATMPLLSIAAKQALEIEQLRRDVDQLRAQLSCVSVNI